MTPRREFSAATRRAAWERANGACEGMVMSTSLSEGGFWKMVRCNAPLDHGNFHYDHIDPDFYGADDRAELENCQLLCWVCHKVKTKHDMRGIAKSKRIQDKLIKARKPRGRPIPGSKRSGLRRRMDGTVERR